MQLSAMESAINCSRVRLGAVGCSRVRQAMLGWGEACCIGQCRGGGNAWVQSLL